MKAIIGIAALLAPGMAAAEVVSSQSNGFVIRHSADVPVPPAAAYAAFGKIGSWWNGDHTYSGDPGNLSLAAQPGGCFCERYGDGAGIEHLRVTYVDPGKRMVLTGALGPLLFEATAGAMDWKFDPAGAGTRVTMTYKVAGFAEGGADKIAPVVDQVLGEQFRRYAAFAARPN